MSDDKSKRIRELNDRFRAGDILVPGRWLFTSGVTALMKENSYEPAKLIQLLGQFDEFSEDNDPYGEHDFGAFEFLEQKLFWKIDYYGHDLKSGSEDPSDMTGTFRLLTIMLAMEY